MNDEPITEDWLRSSGFKWEQLDRQPSKHWLLWLGRALTDPREGRAFADAHDLGIELAINENGDGAPFWYCWIRADYCGRYNRFLHVRHLATVPELVALIEALTGRPFVAADAMYGCLRAPEDAALMRKESERLDRVLARERGEAIDRANEADSSKIETV